MFKKFKPIKQNLEFNSKVLYSLNLVKRTMGNSDVNNEITSLIAKETQRGNVLIAFDKSWIIPNIYKYIKENRSYSMILPSIFRQKMIDIVYKTKFGEITPYKDCNFNFNDLSIHKLNDKYLVFAPINVEEADRIFLYLYKDCNLYSGETSIAIQNIDLSRIKDIEYLYNVKYELIDNFGIIKIKDHTLEELEHIYNYDEYYFNFPFIDDLVGEFTTYLLSECTYFKYPMRWQNKKLYISYGYLLAQDLVEKFALILNQIRRENVKFIKIEDFLTAVDIAWKTNLKIFYHNNSYYAASNTDITLPITSDSDTDIEKYIENTVGSLRVDEITIKHPLTNIEHKDFKKFVKLLGYEVNENKNYNFNIEIGWLTYKIENTEDIITDYYFTSTHDKNMHICKTEGKYNEEIKNKLQQFLNKGFFFTQKALILMTHYPNFVPSCGVINHNLPRNQEELMNELNNIII